jgi:dihydrofolate reductase
MRKVILGFGMTLDGYIARPDGSVDFLVMDKEARKLMADFFATVDTVIMGRKTLDAAIRMNGGSYRSPGKNAAYVFSRSQPAGKHDGYEIVRQSPAALVRKLRQRPGKHIFHMGGGELGRAFLKAGLVDELFLGIEPILLGAGIPAFPGGFPQRAFKLVDNQTYSRGSIALRYRRAP